MVEHICIMRTTVTLPDHLYVEARRLAAARRTSLTALLEEALRALLAEARRVPARPAGATLPYMDGGQPRKGVDLTDTSALWEL
jgi:hypothetical protein